MPERASIREATQLGVELTPGTSVGADRKLQATNIEPAIKADIATFRPLGGKFATLAALGKEWVEAKISGFATYTDIVYLLSSVLAYQAPVQQGATTAYKWTFEPRQSVEDTIKTYTVEHGSTVRAGKFTYGIVTGFGLKVGRESAEISGSMLGQAYQDDSGLTANPTAIEAVPILPTQFEVYLDDTSGAIGATKLTRVLSIEFSISDRFGPVWTLNRAVSGFAAHVETEPKATLKILLEADAAGMGPLTAMRQGDKRYIRVQALGAEAGVGYPYMFELDFCGTVTNVGGFNDEDGVWTLDWTFQATYDSTWAGGKAFDVKVINKLTDL